MADGAIEKIIRKEWAAVPIGPLKDIKAQLNNDERQLLFYLTRDYYRGDGALIDGGAFLGGSARTSRSDPHGCRTAAGSSL